MAMVRTNPRFGRGTFKTVYIVGHSVVRHCTSHPELQSLKPQNLKPYTSKPWKEPREPGRFRP